MSSFFNALTSSTASQQENAQRVEKFRSDMLEKLDGWKTISKGVSAVCLGIAFFFPGLITTPFYLVAAYGAYKFSGLADDVRDIFERAAPPNTPPRQSPSLITKLWSVVA